MDYITNHPDIPVTYHDTEIIKSTGKVYCQQNYSIRRLQFTRGIAAQRKYHTLSIVDLTRMSTGMQELLAVLLLLPIGALITVFFRNLIGVNTFGTFSPCLYALSFVYADWLMGIICICALFSATMPTWK